MATTQVSDILTDVRYDLRDHGKQKYDDTYLVKMINRGIRVLEQELISMGSGLTIATDNESLQTGTREMELNSTVDSIMRVYIDEVELYKLSMENMYRRRLDVTISETGRPYYYATWGKPTGGANGRQMVFDYIADQSYTVNFIYNKLTSDLTTASYMPYDDMFNDYIREGIVILCQKTKDDNILPIDRVWRELFRQQMYGTILSSNRIPIHYKLDF